MTSGVDYHFDDFTEAHYRSLLGMALERYRLLPFEEFNQAGEICLWRHDVDHSLQRAKRIASIDREMGVSTTYFLNVHSEFYSALGESSSAIVREIIGMGHRIGLHFDAGFYAHKAWSGEERLNILRKEKEVLEGMFGVQIGCYSVHNPTVVTDWNFDETVICDMVNVYCREIRTHFTYVSDSNGIWSKGRLADVLEQRPHKLHVLTHPEWWTPEALSPRERISRCIDGRARSLHRSYDQFLLDFLRPNVGHQ